MLVYRYFGSDKKLFCKIAVINLIDSMILFSAMTIIICKLLDFQARLNVVTHYISILSFYLS